MSRRDGWLKQEFLLPWFRGGSTRQTQEPAWGPGVVVALWSPSRLTLWDAMDCSTPGFLVSHHLLDFAQVQVHWISDAIQPSHPLSSPSPPAFNLSHITAFFIESILCIRWPKYRSFSFSISPSNEYSGLVSFRMDWLDLLVSLISFQGTLRSLLQHCSCKTAFLPCSAFFIVHLSDPHMTIGKTTALTIRIFVSELMSKRSPNYTPTLSPQHRGHDFRDTRRGGAEPKRWVCLVFHSFIQPFIHSSCTSGPEEVWGWSAKFSCRVSNLPAQRVSADRWGNWQSKPSGRQWPQKGQQLSNSGWW